MNKIKRLLGRLYKKIFIPKHLFPAGSLVHPKRGTTVFEIDFNWYDEDMQPVSIVRQISNQQIASIRYDEMLGFKEYSGNNELLGSNVHPTIK